MSVGLSLGNPKQVRVIAHAKIKTDKIDAAVLAELYAAASKLAVTSCDRRSHRKRAIIGSTFAFGIRGGRWC
jgi:transposase